MYQCTSGKHWWTEKDDADRCCDPAWRRDLVWASPDKPLPADTASLGRVGNQLYGRVWVKVDPNGVARQNVCFGEL